MVFLKVKVSKISSVKIDFLLLSKSMLPPPPKNKSSILALEKSIFLIYSPLNLYLLPK